MIKGRLKVIFFYLIILSSLLAVGCNKVDKREQAIGSARLMVNELIEARVDNRGVDDIRAVFEKHKENIDEDVWDDWFDIDKPEVEFLLLIAENEGFYPVGNSKDIIQYGENREEGFYYTAVSTMSAEGDYSEGQRDYRVYFVFKFDETGKLNKYMQTERVLEV